MKKIYKILVVFISFFISFISAHGYNITENGTSVLSSANQVSIFRDNYIIYKNSSDGFLYIKNISDINGGSKLSNEQGGTIKTVGDDIYYIDTTNHLKKITLSGGIDVSTITPTNGVAVDTNNRTVLKYVKGGNNSAYIGTDSIVYINGVNTGKYGSDIVISPDGNDVYFTLNSCANCGGGLWKYNIATTGLTRLFANNIYGFYIQISSDGQNLIYRKNTGSSGTDTNIYMISLSNLPGTDNPTNFLTFVNDVKIDGFNNFDIKGNNLIYINTSGGISKRNVQFDAFSVKPFGGILKYVKGGNNSAYIGTDGYVYINGVTIGYYGSDIAIKPDGSEVYFTINSCANCGGGLYRYNVATTGLTRLFANNIYGFYIQISSDGQNLIFRKNTGYSGTDTNIYMLNLGKLPSTDDMSLAITLVNNAKISDYNNFYVKGNTLIYVNTTGGVSKRDISLDTLPYKVNGGILKYVKGGSNSAYIGTDNMVYINGVNLGYYGSDIAIKPDGSEVYFTINSCANCGGGLYRYNVSTSGLTRLFANNIYGFYIQISSDGQNLIYRKNTGYSGTDSNIYTISLSNLPPTDSPTNVGTLVNNVKIDGYNNFYVKGSIIYYVNTNGGISKYDMSNSSTSVVYNCPSCNIQSILASPDNNYIYYSKLDVQGHYPLYRMSLTGTNIERLTYYGVTSIYSDNSDVGYVYKLNSAIYTELLTSLTNTSYTILENGQQFIGNTNTFGGLLLTSNNEVYFSDLSKQGQLYKTNINGTTPQLLTYYGVNYPIEYNGDIIFVYKLNSNIYSLYSTLGDSNGNYSHYILNRLTATEGNMQYVNSTASNTSFGNSSQVKSNFLANYPYMQSWYEAKGLTLDVINNNVDWDNGVTFSKPDVAGGMLDGYKLSAHYQFKSYVETDNHDASIFWRTDLSNTSFQTDTTWAIGLPAYPIRNGSGGIVAYLEFPCGNLICKDQYCSDVKKIFNINIQNPISETILSDPGNGLPYCGDGIKNTMDEECDGNEGIRHYLGETCNTQCKVVVNGITPGCPSYPALGYTCNPTAQPLFPVVANQPPIPTYSGFGVDKNTMKSDTLTATDNENDTLTFANFSNPAHGTLNVLANGSFTYTPTLDYIGADSFFYTVSDGINPVVTQEVTVLVNDVVVGNNPPVPTFGDFGIGQNSSFTGQLTATDNENDTLTYISISTTIHGILVINNDGSFTYLPDNGYTGTDSFTYAVSDGHNLPVEKVVTIIINSGTGGIPINWTPPVSINIGDINTNTGITDTEKTISNDVVCSVINEGYKNNKTIIVTNTMADTSFLKGLKGKDEFIKTLSGSSNNVAEKIIQKKIKTSQLNQKSNRYDLGDNGDISGIQFNLTKIPNSAIMRKLVDLAIDHSSTTMADYEQTIQDSCNNLSTVTGKEVVPAGFIDVNEKNETILNLFRFNGN